MNTFGVVHAVDFSTGVARIGKVHTITKAEDLQAFNKAQSLEKAHEKRRKQCREQRKK